MAARLTDAAEADIRSIARYIAERNRLAARRWTGHVRERIARLGEAPGLGSPRSATRAGLRVLPIGRYLILYRQEGADAVVVRVVHGARRWEDLV